MSVDKRYTLGLMERLARTVPPEPGHTWILDRGSVTYGRAWHVCQLDNETFGHGSDIVTGATERDLQHALGAWLDGYDHGARATR